MKKFILLFAATVLVAQIARANNTIPRNASNLLSGTLPNGRLDKSSVTMLGPTIESSEISVDFSSLTALGPTVDFTEITGAIVDGQIFPGALSRTYDIIIATGPGYGANFHGAGRTPFVQAIASATTVGGKASIFVRKGTYTIENVVSDGIDWIFERGAVLRRANGGQMFRIRNGSINGGIFITTAVAATAITTAAIVLESNSKLNGTNFEQAQDNRQQTTFNEASGFIESSGAVNVAIENIIVSSFTNLYAAGDGRNAFIAVTISSDVVIRNNYIVGDLSGGSGFGGLIKFKNSDILIAGNTLKGGLAGGSGPLIFGVDIPGFLASKFSIVGNKLIERAGGSAIIDGTISSGSFITSNQIIADNSNTYGIHVQGGAYGNFAAAQCSLNIIGNSMSSSNANNRASARFVDISADGNKTINGISVVGNATSQIATFLAESGTVVGTRLKSNSKDGVTVTDQN
jgi:hypothetical protein